MRHLLTCCRYRSAATLPHLRNHVAPRTFYATKSSKRRHAPAPSTLEADKNRRRLPIDNAVRRAADHAPHPHDTSPTSLRQWSARLRSSELSVLDAAWHSIKLRPEVPQDEAVSECLRNFILLVGLCSQYVARVDRTSNTLIQDLRLDRGHVYAVGRYLHTNPNALVRSVGHCCIASAAKHGDHEAIAYELQLLLRNHNAKARSGTSELSRARLRLDKICQDPDQAHFRALTLAARLARENGDHKAAIVFAEKAMKPAMEAYKAVDNATAGPLQVTQKHDPTSKPWLELGMAYSAFARLDEAMNALRSGIDLDDPSAFFLRAKLQRAFLHPDAYTAQWLNDMTKASATGHVQAMVELAEFYASPATLKATGVPLDTDLEYDKAHVTALAESIEDRIQLAFDWLDTAIEYGYIRARFVKARLLGSKTLVQAGTQLSDLMATNSEEKSGVPNPCYNPEVAAECLQQANGMREGLMQAVDGTSDKQTTKNTARRGLGEVH